MAQPRLFLQECACSCLLRNARTAGTWRRRKQGHIFLNGAIVHLLKFSLLHPLGMTSEWKMICWGTPKNRYLRSFVSVRHKNQVCEKLIPLFRSRFKNFIVCFILLGICRFVQCYQSVNSLYSSRCCHVSFLFLLSGKLLLLAVQ